MWKRKRSDPVLWQKAPTPAEISKGLIDNTNNTTKSSITGHDSLFILTSTCASWALPPSPETPEYHGDKSKD